VNIDGVVWAPVNCGYHATDYPYGKLYQWGRKYSQGYSLEYDATVPTIVEGPVDISEGQLESNANVFYTVTSDPYDWASYQNDKLWNSGTEDEPKKTEYDPCPNGWRVPTYKELEALSTNHSGWTSHEGRNGRWFSGIYTYQNNVPQIFLPAAGIRSYDEGGASKRGRYVSYWCSCPRKTEAYGLDFDGGGGGIDYYRNLRSGGYSIRCVKDSNASGKEETVPVETIYMLTESATLAPGTSYTLDTDYEPYNATNTTWKWSSSDASVAYVDASGKVTAIGDGEATITATATDGSGVSASSTISVVAITAVASAEYKDEYGVNHGRGIAIGDVVWAPVNCGYHDTDYPYGKLYQWGRKYGQGYSLEYDATVPTIVEGPVKVSEGQLETNANVFYYAESNPSDWSLYQNDKLWNSGTEAEPNKTQYDPCPEGWRVPTYKELVALLENYSRWTSAESKNGRWFSGDYTYQNNAPQIFFPAAGYRNGIDGVACSRDDTYGRYWCSYPFYNHGHANYLTFHSSYVGMNGSGNGYRVYGYSVRCVQE
jgi:uncharacterized protein (TIGR02145 family)